MTTSRFTIIININYFSQFLLTFLKISQSSLFSRNIFNEDGPKVKYMVLKVDIKIYSSPYIVKSMIWVHIVNIVLECT